MKTLKKLTVLSLVLVMSLMLFACGSDNGIKGNGTQKSPWLVGKDNPKDVTVFIENGFMYVSGNGDMMDFESPEARPWNEAIKEVVNVETAAEITSLGDYALYNAGISKDEVTVLFLTSESVLERLGKSALENANLSLYSSTDFPESLKKVEERALAGTSPMAYTFLSTPSVSGDSFSGCNTEIRVVKGSDWNESNMLPYGGNVTYAYLYKVSAIQEYPDGTGYETSYVEEGVQFEYDAAMFNPDTENCVFDHVEVVSGSVLLDPSNPLILFTPEENVEFKVVYKAK